MGPAIVGSPTVFVNGRPAIRVADTGIHAPCCGVNMWIAAVGSATVLINGRQAHRMGDLQRHCGGVGKMIEGSPNVFVGDGGGGATSGSTGRASRRGGTGAGSRAGSGASAARASAGGSHPAAAPAPSSGSSPSRTAATEPETEHRPVVFAARWEKPTGRFAAPIRLQASCAGAAGKPATFIVRDADDASAAPLTTLSATCGASSVAARWTVHEGPAPQELVFEVAVAGSSARSDVHSILVTAEGTLTIDGRPAAKVPLVLVPGRGAARSVHTDARGRWRVADVPAGEYTLRLEVEDGELE